MSEFETRPRSGGEGDVPPSPLPIGEEVRLLIGSVRAMATAELAYQSARARLMGKSLAWVAGGAVAAGTLLFFVTMALVMGLLLGLTPVIGPWGALGVVAGGLFILVIIAGLVAFVGVRRFMALLRDGKDRT